MSSDTSQRDTFAERFPKTRWTLVLQAREAEKPHAARALEELCRDYWFPIYAFVRRRGHPRHEAQDLTQGFFQRILTDESIQAARQEKGRLRSYLIGTLKRYLSAEREREETLKRGGGINAVPFDVSGGEDRYVAELAETQTPESVFESSWAMELLGRVRARLKESYEKAGKLDVFEVLSEFLPWNESDTPYSGAAVKLNMSGVTVRVQVHRMRTRFRRLLEEQVAGTVETREEVKEELEYLKRVLGG